MCYYIISFFKNKLNSNYIKIFIYYSLISLFSFYPIRDMHHLRPIYFTLLPLLLFYIIKKNIFCNWRNNKYIKYFIILICIYISLIPVNQYFNIYNNRNKKYILLNSSYSSLEGLALKKSNKLVFDSLIKYEKENERNNINTIILNYFSVFIHLSQNKYYKDYDLFMRGNFGENGEERLISEISNSKNTMYILSNIDLNDRKDKINQIPKKVLTFVKDNLKKVDSVYYFDIYSK